MVTGGCKWIGATEVAAMLRFFGVDARIVDFAVGAVDGGGGPGWTWVGGEGGGGTGCGLATQPHGYRLSERLTVKCGCVLTLVTIAQVALHSQNPLFCTVSVYVSVPRGCLGGAVRLASQQEVGRPLRHWWTGFGTTSTVLETVPTFPMVRGLSKGVQRRYMHHIQTASSLSRPRGCWGEDRVGYTDA